MRPMRSEQLPSVGGSVEMASLGSNRSVHAGEKNSSMSSPCISSAADAPRPDQHQGGGVECTHCGRHFPSRTRIFKHL